MKITRRTLRKIIQESFLTYENVDLDPNSKEVLAASEAVLKRVFQAYDFRVGEPAGPGFVFDGGEGKVIGHFMAPGPPFDRPTRSPSLSVAQNAIEKINIKMGTKYRAVEVGQPRAHGDTLSALTDAPGVEILIVSGTGQPNYAY